MNGLKYPLGQQSFEDIRREGKIYVDKTRYINLLLDNKYYFLSRPRRFGKSLFLSTLECFFEGKKELFEGLDISRSDWEWDAYPVIRFDFNGADYTLREGLTSRIDANLSYYEKKYGITPAQTTISERFRNLIRGAHEATGKQTVILVDEYEKSLLDVIDNQERKEEFRNVLNGFYSVLKSEDSSIKLAFLTGVTRFGHLNIFSGLNNLTDISLDPRYTAICGITDEEIEKNLMPGVRRFSEDNGVDTDEALRMLKEYYDGYHFSRDLIDVYNPYSLLTALSTGLLEDTWSDTGNSGYLLNQLKKDDFNLFELEGVEVDTRTLKGTDPEFADPVTLLYQSGYLTIKAVGKKNGTYILGLPNHEVANSLYNSLIPYYLGSQGRLRPSDYSRIAGWMDSGDVEKVIGWLKELFSKITYNVKLLKGEDRLRQENDFQFVIYTIFSLSCGLNNVEIELPTSNGRLDLTVQTPKYVYIFEFKMGETAEKAIRQIDEKEYPLRWASDERKIIKVGVSFSSATRNITDYIIS